MDEFYKKYRTIIIVIAVLVVALIIYLMVRKKMITAAAKNELRHWSGHKEYDMAMHPRLVKYWASAGYDWITPDNISRFATEYPWSAAFISYVVRKYYPEFPKSAAHAQYTVWARERRKAGKTTMIAMEPTEYAPEPGDIIVKGRGYSGDLEGLYASAETHGDIVVSNNGNNIQAIGGNLSHTVKEVRYPATRGYLNSDHFAIIKM